MIVDRRATVFVTRTKHVLVARDRNQEWFQAQTVIAPAMKFEAYYRYGPDLTREISITVIVFVEGRKNVFVSRRSTVLVNRKLACSWVRQDTSLKDKGKRIKEQKVVVRDRVR